MFENDHEYETFLMENVLTTREAADLLEITPAGISYLVKQGKLKVLKGTANGKMFTLREVERYKKERDGVI